MRKTLVAGVMVAGALGSMLAFTGPASASGRPCGPGVSTSGVGSLGSHYTLKSKHDDDGPGGTQVVGEEFEINVPAGQVWDITFADNGVAFFDGISTSTATGIREQHPAPNQPGSQHMTVHAVDPATGQIIDAFVDVPAAPNCGRH